MTLVGADEFKHAATDEPNWQENYMFLGWDEQRSVGIYLHLGHLPGTGVVDARGLVSVDGTVVSAAEEFDVPECLAVPWIKADIVEPLERWRLSFAAPGVVRGADMWLAAGKTTGDVDFGFDIDFRSTVPAVDWAEAWEQLGVPNIMSKHYEAGAKWSGRVWVGDREVDCSGLLIRDHSWGPRDLKNAVQFAWWVPVVFEDGTYQTGTSILRNGKWSGFLLEEAGDGPKLISTDPFVRADGLQVPGGFDTATLLRTRDGDEKRVLHYEARLHTPVYYETMGSHQLDDIYSWVTTPDGRAGFGNLELNLPRA